MGFDIASLRFADWLVVVITHRHTEIPIYQTVPSPPCDVAEMMVSKGNPDMVLFQVSE